MKKSLLISALLCAANIASPALTQSSAQQLDIEVTISPDDQARMGVKVETLAARSVADAVPAYIRAVDIGPLLMLDADLLTARAANAMSASEYARLSKLATQDQSASAQSVEMAHAAATGDSAKVKLLERRLAFEWSPALAEQIANPDFDLIGMLSRREATLIRADTQQQPDGIFGDVAIAVEQNAAPVIAEPIGFSGAVDPRMQTAGLYAIVRGEDAAKLRPGKVFSGDVRTRDQVVGVVIPRSAIIRLDGASWVYVQNADDVFFRREISYARRIKDGWFIEAGFAAGEKIATEGVESLVAVERADESVEAD